jgi:hypothetical protein
VFLGLEHSQSVAADSRLLNQKIHETMGIENIFCLIYIYIYINFLFFFKNNFFVFLLIN